MAGLSLNAAHQVVDAGFVGRLGAEPLAVLALLAGLVAAAGIGLGIGAASATARALGAADPLRARQIAGIGSLAALFLELVLCGGLWAGREVALVALGTPGDLRPLAAGYLPVLSLTIGGAILQILCDFLAIGRGEVGMRLRTLVLCFGLNIALDPLFIFGFGLGLNGAA
ncbi:MATE family efflux transporter [Pseudodonghicola sp.]|uniref:MATE family efflux transporter n=1 Tax=Pseudodonghicola sp. TaxID=1969463 RepID=UPI003A97F9CE